MESLIESLDGLHLHNKNKIISQNICNKLTELDKCKNIDDTDVNFLMNQMTKLDVNEQIKDNLSEKLKMVLSALYKKSLMRDVYSDISFIPTFGEAH